MTNRNLLQNSPSPRNNQRDTIADITRDQPEPATKSPSPEIISEAPPSQIPQSPTDINETPVSQMPHPENTNNTDTQILSTNNTTKTTPGIAHPTMELTIDEFPNLRTKTNNTTTQPEQSDFSDDSMDQSPLVTSNLPLQITFKRPPVNTLESEDHSTLTSLSRDQRNSVIHVCRELRKYSFRDVNKLQNVNTDKKRRIISKAMYIELGDFDPSNEYIANYSHAKTIRLYHKLTEKRMDLETLYLQIYNQLNKQDKLKRTKQDQQDETYNRHRHPIKNMTTHNSLKTSKFKTLTVNVNDLNNFSKRNKVFKQSS